MGFLWDLWQESRLEDQQSKAESLEHRVERLEKELKVHRKIIQTLIERLEKRFGEDLNGDGRIGLQ